MTESEWIVTMTNEGVSCTRPDGRVESVKWSDLNLVAIVTTDDGPFSPDVFLLLTGEESGCAIPLGGSGADELLKKLQALPGFDNSAVIKAMCSTDNNRFICWRRDTG